MVNPRGGPHDKSRPATGCLESIPPRPAAFAACLGSMPLHVCSPVHVALTESPHCAILCISSLVDVSIKRAGKGQRVIKRAHAAKSCVGILLGGRQSFSCPSAPFETSAYSPARDLTAKGVPREGAECPPARSSVEPLGARR